MSKFADVLGMCLDDPGRMTSEPPVAAYDRKHYVDTGARIITTAEAARLSGPVTAYKIEPQANPASDKLLPPETLRRLLVELPPATLAGVMLETPLRELCADHGISTATLVAYARKVGVIEGGKTAGHSWRQMRRRLAQG